MLKCVMPSRSPSRCSFCVKALLIATNSHLWRAGFVSEGLLLIFFCMTKGEKREIDDSGDSGGILLKSNTEAPGEEVVRSHCSRHSPLCYIASFPQRTLLYVNGFPLFFHFVRRTRASLPCPLLWSQWQRVQSRVRWWVLDGPATPLASKAKWITAFTSPTWSHQTHKNSTRANMTASTAREVTWWTAAPTLTTSTWRRMPASSTTGRPTAATCSR